MRDDVAPRSIPAKPANFPPDRSLWIHKGNGRQYYATSGVFNATTDQWDVSYLPGYIIKGHQFIVFTRSLENFLERFEPYDG